MSHVRLQIVSLNRITYAPSLIGSILLILTNQLASNFHGVYTYYYAYLPAFPVVVVLQIQLLYLAAGGQQKMYQYTEIAEKKMNILNILHHTKPINIFVCFCFVFFFTIIFIIDDNLSSVVSNSSVPYSQYERFYQPTVINAFICLPEIIYQSFIKRIQCHIYCRQKAIY